MTEAPRTASIQRDMAVTVDDFRRTLPVAAIEGFRVLGTHREADIQFADSAGDGAAEHIIVATCQDRRVAFALTIQEKRKLGAISLPSTRVRIVFDGFSADAAARFLACFDDYFRRGGG